MPQADRVLRHTGIDFNPGFGSVIILDDCDDFMLEDPLQFMKFSKKAACISLTATCQESYNGGIENNVLNKM